MCNDFIAHFFSAKKVYNTCLIVKYTLHLCRRHELLNRIAGLIRVSW